MRYILASQSPRRQELMKEISSSFLVDVSHVNEDVDDGISPIEAVQIIAKRKGEAVRQKYKDDIVISADTIVVIDNKIIGKPKDAEDAKRILELLNNKIHYVHTAYFIFYKEQVISNVVTTKVFFNDNNDVLIDSYIKSGSPLDKAGAYGYQDNKKFPIVHHIEGSRNNVIGFPVEEIKESLRLLAIDN